MPSDLEMCYKFPRVELHLTNEWVREFVRNKEYHIIISEWYDEGNTFKAKYTWSYPTTSLK